MTEEEKINNHLINKCGGRAELEDNVASSVATALHKVLDGREFNDLEACEKTYFGVKFEKEFVQALDLPRKIGKKNNPHNLPLDTRIDDIDIDIKCTIGSNWMIPREALGHWCILVKVDLAASTFDFGVLQMTPDVLRSGANQDKKLSVSAEGKTKIVWFFRGSSFAAHIDPIARAEASAEMVFRDLETLVMSADTKPIAHAATLPRRSGVYVLQHEDEMVYVGKTKNLRNRLRKHKRTIDDAEKLLSEDVKVTTVTLSEHLMVGLEEYLINRHRPAWNGRGFGSNAHGKGREGQRLSDWNKLYGRKVTR